jgi:hypothetical protein
MRSTPGQITRRAWHRAVFLAAGAYNIAWGLYAVFDPNWFFRYAKLEPLNHPEIFACLGMVIGLYGVLYLEVARRPERGFPIAAIGLAGKLLGPIGLAFPLLSGRWPLRAVLLCVTNDVIWWVPFAIYLVDSWPLFKRDLGRSDVPPG